ncbi:glycosyltransferase [Patescibacteria group bacterium]|nr:glycosyltransferase [Patescibacteria group bacterium]
MKGVILAGGGGTRLYPNTKVTNKHLLPVYNQPMIYYPINTLMRAGIEDILIMPGRDHAGDFAKLLGSGKEFNANFSFKVQDHAGGLAYAVGLAREFVGEDNFVVILGDNILEDNIIEDVQTFSSGAKIFLKKVHDPERFGVAELDGTKIISIEEKPVNPKSDWAAIGVYIYDAMAFDYIKELKPSSRGELEITDLNNIYVKRGTLEAGFVKGYWFDTGTHESLVDAAYILKNIERPMDPLKLEEKNAPKIVIGAILYNNLDNSYRTDQYLPYFIESVKKQDYKNVELIFIDNSDSKENPNAKFLSEFYPNIKVIYAGENTGFAKANNILIKEARSSGADYFISSNVDMVYDANVVSELLNAVMKTPQVASATCKIKRWDFSRVNESDLGKTNIIDAVGIDITREHRFINRGESELDYGQFNEESEVFGASGAAVIYRMSVFDDVAFKNKDGYKEYFDELMFMYKEDVDLSYRFQLAGYKCIYTPKAVIYHDRTVKIKPKGCINIVRSRIGRNKKYKEWSWLNHHIILQKMLEYSSFDVKLSTFWYEIKTLGYVVVFEPFLFKQAWQLFKLRDRIAERRDQLKKRVKIKVHIEKLMVE